MKNRRLYIVSMLLCVSLIMLIATVMPHHHHRGYFCMQNDVEQCPVDRTSAHGGCSDCKSCCITNFQCAIPGDDTRVDLSPDYSFESLLFTLIYFQLLPSRDGVERAEDYFCYLEKLHSIYISSAVGLRAPPFTVA